MQRVSRFQIGLIEAGEGQPRSCRDEQRVEKVVVPVQRLVTCGELELNPIETSLGQPLLDDDVPIANARVNVPATDTNPAKAVGRLREVEDQASPGLQRELNDGAAGDQ